MLIIISIVECLIIHFGHKYGREIIRETIADSHGLSNDLS